MRCESKFRISGWDEKPFSESGDGAKLTQASVKRTYEGELQGEGVAAYVMAYQADGSAEFVGYERVAGSLKGNSGSFVWKHSGAYIGDRMTHTSAIVEGSGTGDLIGISGHTEILAGHRKDYPFTLEYELSMAEVPIWGS